MLDTKTLLRETRDRIAPPQDVVGSLERRRQRQDRNRRVAAGVVGIAVFALAAIGFVRLLGSEGTPAGEPRSPFEGTWVSTSDTDGGTQTMTVRVSGDDAVEITVRDDVATVCSGTPSTMTGTGRIEAGTQLVIPAPVYTCDDGSDPQALSGPPLQEQLRDWTLFLDPQTDTLSDGVGGLWRRRRSRRTRDSRPSRRRPSPARRRARPARPARRTRRVRIRRRLGRRTCASDRSNRGRTRRSASSPLSPSPSRPDGTTPGTRAARSTCGRRGGRTGGTTPTIQGSTSSITRG